jgi:hypothetical protein
LCLSPGFYGPISNFVAGLLVLSAILTLALARSQRNSAAMAAAALGR